MPELPEVETIRRELDPLLEGKTFAEPRLIYPTTIAYPEADAFIGDVEGRSIKEVGRRGKYLIFTLDRGFLVVHLRMTGNLIFKDMEPEHEDKFLRVVLPFTDGSALHYSDMRRFGRIWLVEDRTALAEKVLKKVGPDIYTEMDCENFLDRISARGKRRLKALLLDQEFAAGMGNIYTDECLYRCGFHPMRSVGDLDESEKKELYSAVKTVLEEGIAYGGTSFRDYRSASGALGEFQSRLAVYGRRGEACPRCGTVIEKTVVAGRGTYFCPCCQREKSLSEGEK